MKDSNSLEDLEKGLGYRFADTNVLLTALTHSSWANEHGGTHNERLEFLGDAVIESVTSDYVFIEFPEQDEGFMTQLRSRIVSRQSLNALAVKLGLDKQVIAGAGAGLAQKHIFGDAFEAMMGAIYLDQGYEFVNRLLINNIFFRYLNIDELTRIDPDYKSRLIEWCQKGRHRIEFHSSRDEKSSPSHPSFSATVEIDGMKVGYGSGESKKEAEQQAAYSVAHAMNDEQCASLLDHYDRLTR